ncbi:MAG: DNA-binding response regulator [Cycloclasticus sp. symbiont of Poecilosclerida sp. M]|nr:MAG: DNA-binding response regulator [Cycloclasticus sp. symbiont of Poecilosclerida sp. M]
MKILIADDEPLARQRLKRMVGEISSDYVVCAEAENGLQALNFCHDSPIDLALLDIRMPVMDGLQAAVEINKASAKTAIIFVTAFDAHALEAFDSQAIDYLLKPVKKQRLQQALEKAQRSSSADTEQVSTIGQDLMAPRQHLCEHSHSGIRVINSADILCFKAEQKYVTAQAASSSILLSESLQSLEHEFAEHFTRIHRNALIRIDAIRLLKKAGQGQQQLFLNGIDKPIEVSRRHLAGLRKLVNEIR